MENASDDKSGDFFHMSIDNGINFPRQCAILSRKLIAKLVKVPNVSSNKMKMETSMCL